jgi:hypothetical protein
VSRPRIKSARWRSRHFVSALLTNRGAAFPECRAFLARRRGARSLQRGCGRRGRDGALKTDWTKPWHGGASYGDRMAPAIVNRGLERTATRSCVAQSSDNGMHAWLALGRCRDRRVRAALLVGWAAKCSGGLVAASSRSEALGGVSRCHDVSWIGRHGLAGLSTSMMTMRPR